jgi:hypothetical protein
MYRERGARRNVVAFARKKRYFFLQSEAQLYATIY